MTDAATLISVEEYLAMDRKPNCDYVDGVVAEKSLPSYKHSLIQARIIELMLQLAPSFRTTPEVNVQIRPGKYLVPDLIVQARSFIQSPYPDKPVHLCVEVTSPADRFSAVLAKCEEYLIWGVKIVWIIDPDQKKAWTYSRENVLAEVALEGCLTAESISIPLAEVFSEL